MPSLRVMTFNAENMMLRFNFKAWKADRLDPLKEVSSDLERAKLIQTYWHLLHQEDRELAALAIAEGNPDVVCMQEVENLRTLKTFHKRYIQPLMADSYPYKILIEGNDPRGIDVAVMSRYPIDGATSHQEHVGTIEFPHGRVTQEVFRRDCLEVHIQKDHKVLPIFVCHFKSMGGNRLDTRPIRTAEAAAVRQILVNRFGDPSQEPWLVVGDLNDYTETDGVPDEDHALGPLVNKEFSVDWVKRISDPLNRWTHHYQGDDSYHQLDYMLASPMLADLNPQVLPRIIRKGIPHRARRYQGDRFPHIGHHHPKASDHCPVVVDLEF